MIVPAGTLEVSLVPSGGPTLMVGNQIWGFSCEVQRQPPANISLNESLPQKTPDADTMFMAAMAMVLPKKLLKIFKVS
jgi:hypothetical protein